jgi:acetyl-CoA carboxylase biotin carboxyl carrier protein
MSLDLEKIEKLIRFMEQHGLNELQVKEGDLEFRARKEETKEQHFVYAPAHGIVHAAPAGALTPIPGPAPILPGQTPAPEAGAEPVRKKTLKEICSPIVGTFYRRPNPKNPPYKEVGDRVEKNDVVCVVEAMKVMNEIPAEVSGVIRKILVEDGQPVEFGQPLFLVETD